MRRYPARWGEVAERLKAALLKSAELKDFVGSNPTLSAISASPMDAQCARWPYGAGVGVGVAVPWLSRPFKSKIEAFPDGTSITVILSASFWMYWY